MNRNIAACVFALSTVMSTPVRAAPETTTTSEIKELIDVVLSPESLREVSGPLIAKLSPAELKRLGKFAILTDDERATPQSPCAGTVRLSYTVRNRGGTTIHLCRGGMSEMTNFVLVSALFPMVAENFPAITLPTLGEPPVTYMKLLVSASIRSRGPDKTIVFPLTRCDAFSFLRLYLDGRTSIDCSDADPIADRTLVLRTADSSTAMKRGLSLDKAMPGYTPDQHPIGSYVGGHLAASLSYIQAHELAHALCIGEKAFCSDETNIDSAAIELILRNSTAITNLAMVMSIQNILLFSSLFNDSEIPYDKTLNQMAVSKEVEKRRGMAACRTVAVVEDFARDHPDTMAQIEELAKRDALLNAIIQNKFGLLRGMMTLQCAVLSQQ